MSWPIVRFKTIIRCPQSGRADAKKGQHPWGVPYSSSRNSYPRISHSLRWLEWSCQQIQCWMWGVHGGHGWGTRNTDGERLLEIAKSCNLVIHITCFKRRPNHLTIFTSGDASSHRLTMCSFVNPSTSICDMSRLSLARRSSSITCWSVISVLTSLPSLIRNLSLA